MPPQINMILGGTALFDAAVFWFIGQAVASGNLKKPIPSHLSDEEKAKREFMHRRGGTAVLQAAPAMAVLGLIVMGLPMQPPQMAMVFAGGILSIVGWILYYTLSGYWAPPEDRNGERKSGSDRNLPIR